MANSGLFLLEVLVDKITFTKTPCFTDRDFRTCVSIECSGVEPIEICDDEPCPLAKNTSQFMKIFNSGKSVLFSLKDSDISAAMSRFPLKIHVYKSLPCDCLPTRIVMGECTIDMTAAFMEARQNYLKEPNKLSYQSLKDAFQLLGPDKEPTGEIVMFLRISCFGKRIVTQFQGAPNINTACSTSGVIDRPCTPNKDYQSREDPCVCGGAIRAAADTCPKAVDPYDSMPCEDPEEICYCSGPRAEKNKPDMLCRNTSPYCLHLPKGPSKQYEEIGSNLNGNELRIKVPAGAAIIKKISLTHCSMQRPYTKRKNDGPCEPPCGKNQISLALPNEAICCQGAQPAGTQFTCTTEACLQAPRHGQSILARGDTKTQDEPPPNKDTFVFKVLKTALEGDRKCQMELEFVAPKGPDKSLPVGKANTAIQSNLDCTCRVPRLKSNKTKKKSII